MKHWSYVISDKALIFDFDKNFEILSGFYLHTKNKCFHNFKDMGQEGIEMILKKHKCNKFCLRLGFEEISEKKLKIKCKNLFCNKFSSEKYCIECTISSKVEQSILCNHCNKNFIIYPNKCKFKGRSARTTCKNCNPSNKEVKFL